MILVAEKKNFRGVIRCPYHSWCYSMKGELKATPHVGGPGLNEHDSVDNRQPGSSQCAWACFLMRYSPICLAKPSRLRIMWRRLPDAGPTSWARPIFHGGAGLPFCAGGPVQLEAGGRELLRELPPAMGASGAEQLFPAGGSLQHRAARHVFRPGHHGLFPELQGAIWLSRFRRSARQVGQIGRIHRALSQCAVRRASRSCVLDPAGAARAMARRASISSFTYRTGCRSVDRTTPICAHRTQPSGKRCSWRTSSWSKACRRAAGATGFDGGVFSPVMDAATHCFHDWVARKLG
jgi:choline monooxygenase